MPSASESAERHREQQRPHPHYPSEDQIGSQSATLFCGSSKDLKPPPPRLSRLRPSPPPEVHWKEPNMKAPLKSRFVHRAALPIRPRISARRTLQTGRAYVEAVP